MPTYTQEQLEEILDLYGKWLRDEEGGKRANLRKADLSKANLRKADLSKANLSYADLRYANLYGANLYGANLRKADLSKANLSYADLRYANLSGANLCHANLYGANLYGANLRDSNLRDSNLRDANLRDANLYGANLSYFILCPEVGEFTAFKKLSGGVIATLLIPSSAKRTSSIVGRKCRAEFAQVVELSHGEEASSRHNEDVIYRVGETVYPDKYDDDIRVECTHGIHFFITRKEAEDY